MKCIIDLRDEKAKEVLGESVTQEEFEKFCKDAIVWKLVEHQLINDDDDHNIQTA